MEGKTGKHELKTTENKRAQIAQIRTKTNICGGGGGAASHIDQGAVAVSSPVFYSALLKFTIYIALDLSFNIGRDMNALNCMKWYPDILPKDTLPKDIFSKDSLLNGQFADGHFVERTICRMDNLTNGLFAEKTFCRKDNLPKM